MLARSEEILLAEAAAADHMVFEVADFLFEGFALALAGVFDAVEPAQNQRRTGRISALPTRPERCLASDAGPHSRLRDS